MPFVHSSETVRLFWDRVRSGESAGDAAVAVGVAARTGWWWFVKAGGVKPNVARDAPRRYRRLSFLEREQIALGVAAQEPVRSIATRLGRAPSTVSREIKRN
ncbi:hypothetical protein GCM10009856_55060 [Mycolicibacterium llatzerense]